MKYIFNISPELDDELKAQIIEELEKYLSEYNFSLETVPCYGLKKALSEILPKYDCERYFSITSQYGEGEILSADILDGSLEWYAARFKKLATLFKRDIAPLFDKDTDNDAETL